MIKFAPISVFIAFLLASCGITRIEEDIYTKTLRDTLETHFVKNAPGNRDGGIVYPSSRTIEKERFTTLNDSVATRRYPDFIRLGLFESAGIFGGDQEFAIGSGIFGVYPDYSALGESYRGDESRFVPGGIYRVGIIEKRLRWFHDAKNWTWGLHLFEAIFPDARFENSLIAVPAFYIRKRFFIREEIPYIAFTPTVGFGLFPSTYINTGATFDIGSIGGINIRAYAGIAVGTNSGESPQVSNNEFVADQDAYDIVAPYAGLGISVLDFLNLVPETYREWDDQYHSSWEIGLARFGLISSTAESLDPADTNDVFIDGFLFRLADASVAIPILNHRIFAGTSLLNIVELNDLMGGISVLPIRLGYWLTAVKDDLTVEPFIEYNYYPSSFFHIAAKTSFRISKYVNLAIDIGYANGDSDGDFLGWDDFGETSFSGFYLGFSVGLLDRIFSEEELRYSK